MDLFTSILKGFKEVAEMNSQRELVAEIDSVLKQEKIHASLDMKKDSTDD